LSWRDRLREGSFRGAAFHIEGADQSGGRRLAVHEFPQRDGAMVEDLGRRPHGFDIDCLVIGPNYDQARDALIAALDAAGPGSLVHPYRGTLTLSVESWRARESKDDGGAAFFNITFISEGETRPTQTADSGSAVEAAAVAASAEGQEGLQERFSVGGLPGFVAEGGAARLGALADGLQGAMGRLRSAREAMSNIGLRIANLRSGALTLVRQVPNMGAAVAGLIADIRLLADTPRAAYRELRNLIGFSTGEAAPGQTPARMAERRNAEALDRQITLTASAEASRAVAAMTFDSYDDALEVREDLVGRIDAAALTFADAGDDGAYQALRVLGLAVVRDITARGGNLSRLYDYSPVSTEPVLVTAQRLYGDARRAEEIVERNRVAHPGFVPAGQRLEVLSDV
jgi:prophage DNA circulation protein